MLAEETPASFVAFDLLAVGDDDLRERAARASGGARLEAALAGARPPRPPDARRRAIARWRADWFERFEGAGLDGVIAKRARRPYQPGKRAMIKIKHARTADCVVAGFRWHKDGPGELVGSLLLGLYDDDGRAAPRRRHARLHGGRRRELAEELAPLREDALDGHPWRDGRPPTDATTAACPARRAAGTAGKDLSWEPLRIERVCEVDVRPPAGRPLPPRDALPSAGAPTSRPRDCRYDQLEVTPPYELAQIFAAGS